MNYTRCVLKHAAALGCAFLLGVLPANAHGADRGKATATVGGKTTVTIDYGRPTLNNRDPLSLAVVGKPWRLGADAATTLTTDGDLMFGTSAVPKGTYTLTATKTGDAAWTLNIVKPATDHASPVKVADVPLTQGTAPAAAEELTIALDAASMPGSLTITWGTTSLSTHFSGR